MTIGPNGQPNDAGPVDLNFQTIEAEINGNLDDGNIQSLSLAKLLQSGASLNDVVTWNGVNYVPAPTQSELPIDLGDITQSGATEGQMARWRGAGPAWTAEDVPTDLPIDLADITQSGAAEEQVATWQAPNWVPLDVPKELPPAALDGDVLTLVAGQPTWVTPAPPPAQDVELIGRVSIGSNQNSIDIAVPSGYAALKMSCRIRSNAGGGFIDIWCRINGISANSYFSQQVSGVGVATLASESLSAAQWVIGVAPASTAVAGSWGQTDVNFAEPQGGANKTFTSQSTFQPTFGTGNTWSRAHAGHLANPAEITSIGVLPAGGAQWISGSAISLYGYK